jgi:hypothetical protein
MIIILGQPLRFLHGNPALWEKSHVTPKSTCSTTLIQKILRKIDAPILEAQ